MIPISCPLLCIVVTSETPDYLMALKPLCYCNTGMPKALLGHSVVKEWLTYTTAKTCCTWNSCTGVPKALSGHGVVKEHRLWRENVVYDRKDMLHLKFVHRRAQGPVGPWCSDGMINLYDRKDLCCILFCAQACPRPCWATVLWRSTDGLLYRRSCLRAWSCWSKNAGTASQTYGRWYARRSCLYT